MDKIDILTSLRETGMFNIEILGDRLNSKLITGKAGVFGIIVSNTFLSVEEIRLTRDELHVFQHGKLIYYCQISDFNDIRVEATLKKDGGSIPIIELCD
jgi:hypothetical protein